MFVPDNHSLQPTVATTKTKQLLSDSLILRGESMKKYKSLLDNGWTEDKLNKHIKEQLIQPKIVHR